MLWSRLRSPDACVAQLTSNYWNVEHIRGSVLMSSAVYESWTVVPQLENVDVILFGALLLGWAAVFSGVLNFPPGLRAHPSWLRAAV